MVVGLPQPQSHSKSYSEETKLSHFKVWLAQLHR